MVNKLRGTFCMAAILGAATAGIGPVRPAAAHAQEAPDTMASTVGQWFSMIERQFVALADAMPADKYGFKPSN
jgi:hypothetical protein